MKLTTLSLLLLAACMSVNGARMLKAAAKGEPAARAAAMFRIMRAPADPADLRHPSPALRLPPTLPCQPLSAAAAPAFHSPHAL